MGNGLSSDQGSFTPHGLRDVERFGAEQRQHDWSNPENNNQLAGAAPNNGELNSLSKFNRRQTRLESVDCGGEQINSEPSSSPNSHNSRAVAEKPRDAAVNSDRYRNLQRHRAVLL